MAAASPTRGDLPVVLAQLLDPGDVTRGVFDGHHGTVVYTADRALVATRERTFGVTVASTTHVFRLADVGRVSLARAVSPLGLLLGALCGVAGLGALVGGGVTDEPAAAIAVGLVLLLLAAVLVLASMRMVLAIGSSSGSVGFRVQTGERAAARAFTAQLGHVLR